MITDRLDFGSHLNLCLTQKWFCQMIDWPPVPNVLDWVNFNVDFEKHAAGRRKHLICVECARLLPTANFQAQIHKANPKRFCIQCRILKMGCKKGFVPSRGRGKYVWVHWVLGGQAIQRGFCEEFEPVQGLSKEHLSAREGGTEPGALVRGSGEGPKSC